MLILITENSLQEHITFRHWADPYSKWLQRRNTFDLHQKRDHSVTITLLYILAIKGWEYSSASTCASAELKHEFRADISRRRVRRRWRVGAAGFKSVAMWLWWVADAVLWHTSTAGCTNTVTQTTLCMKTESTVHLCVCGVLVGLVVGDCWSPALCPSPAIHRSSAAWRA